MIELDGRSVTADELARLALYNYGHDQLQHAAIHGALTAAQAGEAPIKTATPTAARAASMEELQAG